VPNAPVSGYVAPGDVTSTTSVQSVATGTVGFRTVDPMAVQTNSYQVSFTDVSDDGIDNDGNGKRDDADLNEIPRITATYSVLNLSQQSFSFTAKDTMPVKLPHENVDPTSVLVKNGSGPVDASKYRIDPRRGDVRASAFGALSGNYEILYKYYPVYQSPYIKNNPYITEALDSDIFDGLQLVFSNDWQVRLIDSLSGFNTGSKSMIYTFSTTSVIIGPNDTLRGVRFPSDYEIRFSNGVVDTSAALYGASALPVNFTVFNVTEGHKIPFIYIDNDGNGKLSSLDELSFFDYDIKGKPVYTWTMSFVNRPSDPPNTVYDFVTGDKVTIKTTKPFRKGDAYRFEPVMPKVDVATASQSLERIRVVPNPYVAATTHEAPLPAGVTSGRGERKIDFIHLPPQSVINIYTSRGEHIITLRHDKDINDGSVSWNLKSKENLDIAYGVYFYVVEAPAGTRSGKIAIIK
jgi:hypothetical protein